MNDAIVIYGVPNDANNDLVRQQFRQLPGVKVGMVFCPPSVRDLYPLPFIVDETGGRHFGMEGIKTFISSRTGTKRVS